MSRDIPAARTTRVADATPYVTKDGSTIRELMHPAVHGATHGVANQSLALAEVAPGAATTPHRHRSTEELYHFLDGSGVMDLDGERFAVEPGDTVCIRPGARHAVANTGTGPLRILCCCAPAYGHEDTDLDPEPA
ncbi:MAG: cupin domain-containing protein [Desulfovibrionaceae bacterium]|jgi:mannose-6-phosphate isomerase-like protein (cupin superfamily)|nr:cupin domain-containing protein [Desulfovibrionaceae bacterium]